LPHLLPTGRRFTLIASRITTAVSDVNKWALYKQLELHASRGASLRELENAIEEQGHLLDEVQREEAWLYAWALTKREERRLPGSVWDKEQGYGFAGDAGAG
jgi:hypothetical protein